MPEMRDDGLDELVGTVDERVEILRRYEAEGRVLPAAWLLRQLTAALAAWAQERSDLDIEIESRADF